MASQDDYPLAAQVLLNHSEKLSTAVCNPKRIAASLHSRGFICEKAFHSTTTECSEPTKSTQWLNKEIILEIHQTLCVNPEKFSSVLEVLRCDDSLQSLCDQMDQEKGS